MRPKKKGKRSGRKVAKKRAEARISRIERIAMAGVLLGVGALIGGAVGGFGGRRLSH